MIDFFKFDVFMGSVQRKYRNSYEDTNKAKSVFKWGKC